MIGKATADYAKKLHEDAKNSTPKHTFKKPTDSRSQARVDFSRGVAGATLGFLYMVGIRTIVQKGQKQGRPKKKRKKKKRKKEKKKRKEKKKNTPAASHIFFWSSKSDFSTCT